MTSLAFAPLPALPQEMGPTPLPAHEPPPAGVLAVVGARPHPVSAPPIGRVGALREAAAVVVDGRTGFRRGGEDR